VLCVYFVEFLCINKLDNICSLQWLYHPSTKCKESNKMCLLWLNQHMECYTTHEHYATHLCLAKCCLHQGCPTGASQGWMWFPAYTYVALNGITNKLTFYSMHELEGKEHILNVLFIYMMQNMQPAVLIWTSLYNESYGFEIK